MGDAELWRELEKLSLSRTKAADTLIRIGSTDSAREGYEKAIRDILQVPSGSSIISQHGSARTAYKSISDADKAELMAALVGMAKCEESVGNRFQALLWLEEAQLVYLNMRWSECPHLYDWTDWFPDNVNLAVQYGRARTAASDVSLYLMNTGTALHRRYSVTDTIPDSVTKREPVIDRAILPSKKLTALVQLRHPDPVRISNQQLVDSSLQVLGSWTKLKIKRSTNGPGRRMSFSGFIWEGNLYIAGGRKDSLGPFYRDIWSLDLDMLDGWKALPNYPQSMSMTSAFLGWQILPHPRHKKAYLFTGRSTLDFFDLTTKTWGTMSTKFHHAGQVDTVAGINPARNPWPYPKGQLTDSTQQLLGDRLYVFGGTHGDTSIGCNLFVVLDLNTKTWTRLSGSVMPTKDADPQLPGPRKTPCSWVDSAQDVFYILFGECDRMGAQYSGEIHGADHGHAFDDFWSWRPSEGCWRRERWVGNAPCPRSETACVYNGKLNKTILWGGYNPDLPTVFPNHHVNFSFSYFADTFTYDGPQGPGVTSGNTSPSVAERRWRQVITTSFPTYRAQSMLFADPISGRTFLYGGFSNNDYVPSRISAISRSFGDVWELRIDSANGENANIDFETERRSARMGPWQRCFACGCAGEWKKCGGSCRGRVYFCDQDCLRDGWKEHKSTHGCRKLE